jgi:DNA polymerase III delta subunit
MPEINASSLKKMLKTSLSRVYFIYGKNVNETEKTVNAIIKRAISPDSELFNFHRFNDRNFSAAEFANACSALPVFSDYTCTVVHDIVTEKLLADDVKMIIDTIQNLCETNVVVFYFTGYDITDGKKYPMAKAKKIVDICMKIGTVCVCNPKSQTEITKDIITYISANHGEISHDSANFLANICGFDSQIIRNECDKLLSYNKIVTTENIEKLTPKQLDSNIYELARAVQNSDKKNVLKILHSLFIMRVEPISIMYSLSGTILDIYRVKLAEVNAKTSQNVKDDFSYPKVFGFRVDNAFRDVRKLRLSQIKHSLKIFSEIDLQMKSTSMDSEILLETAIIQMME